MEACKPWSDKATPEDVALLIDRAIEAGTPFEILKPAVSKLLNLLYDSLRGAKYESVEGEWFLRSLVSENRGSGELLTKAKTAVASMNMAGEASRAGLLSLRGFIDSLGALEIHYQKKENILFPRFEVRYPEYRCVRLMWSIQDDVRRSLRRLLELLGEPDPLLSELNGEIGKLYFNVHAVIFREEAIVFPILSKLFDIRELNEMFAESATFGFCFLAPREQDIFLEQARIIGASLPKSDIRSTAALSGKSLLQLATGALSLDVLEAILRTLPVDATFVDAADHVAWFSNNPNRIFPRTPSILGRDVRNCHPKESVDKVVALLEDFKSGRRDREAFWIQRKDSFIHIEYFALRGPGGRYLGTLEVSQDLTGKRSLKGEKRLA